MVNTSHILVNPTTYGRGSAILSLGEAARGIPLEWTSIGMER